MNPWLRLGLRLTLGGGRRAWTWMALLASGAAIGAVLLLGALAAPGVVDAQQDRYEQRNPLQEFAGSSGGLRIAEVQDGIGGRRLVRIAAAVTGTGGAPLPPGVAALPRRDEAVVSPALAELIRTDERARARFPQRIIGTIGPAGLVAPDELRAWVGVDPAELADGDVVTGFGPGTGPPVELWTAILAMAVIFAPFLLLPLAVLLGTCARMSAGAPDRRLATLRLLGATRRQAQLVTAAEAGLVSAVGALLGTAGFLLLRPVSGTWHLGRFHWYPADIHTPPAMLAGVVAVLVVFAVSIATYGAPPPDPLAVHREEPSPRPHPARLLVPALGLATVASVLVPGLPLVLRGPLFFGGVLLCASGLPAAAPVLTAWTGRRLATAAVPVWLRLAGRRLDHTPSHAPRLVASIVVSVFLAGVGLAAAAGYADWQRTGTATATFDVYGPAGDLRAAPGVAGLLVRYDIASTGDSVFVGTCDDLRHTFHGAESCQDGRAYDLNGGWDDEVTFEIGGKEVVVELDPSPLDVTARGEESSGWPSVFVSSGAVPSGATLSTRAPAATVTLSTGPRAIEAFSQYLAVHHPATRLEGPREFSRHPKGHLGLPLGLGGAAAMTLTSVGLAVATLLAGAAFGIAAVDRIIERRRGNARLTVAGAPRRVVAAAEFASAAIPLVLGVALAAACAVTAVAVWAQALSLSTSDLLRAAAPALWAAAALLPVLAAIASAAARQRVTADLLRRA